jgi:hypothetical protein
MMIRLLIAASGLLSVTAVQAQELPDAAAWQDTVSRLQAEQQALRSRLLVSDTSAVEVASRDGLRILATPGREDRARQVLDRVVSARRRWFGAAPPESEFTISLHLRDREGGWASSTSPVRGVIIVTTARGASERRGVLRRNMEDGSAELLADRVLREYAEVVAAAIATPTRTWLAPGLPLERTDRERRSEVRYQVVTGTGTRREQCVGGEVSACAGLLGLMAPGSGPLFPRLVRADLVLTALDIGGPEAWLRFQRAASVSPTAALEAAAGVPTDSLITLWWTGLLEERAGEVPLPPRAAVIAIGWLGILIAGTVGAARWL